MNIFFGCWVAWTTHKDLGEVSEQSTPGRSNKARLKKWAFLISGGNNGEGGIILGDNLAFTRERDGVRHEGKGKDSMFWWG